jgi:Putative peptidoglycan binding domain
LGVLGRLVGRRTLRCGMRGWDVAYLQFELAMHGFPSGTFDGHFGPHTDGALRRYQEWAGLVVDGHAGRLTMRALRAPPAVSPLTFTAPVYVSYTDGLWSARRAHACRGRLSGAGGDAGARRALGRGHCRCMDRGLRQGRRGPTQPERQFPVRAPVGDPRQGRTDHRRTACRTCRLDRDLVGAAPDFEVRVRGAAVDPVPSFR